MFRALSRHLSVYAVATPALLITTSSHGGFGGFGGFSYPSVDEADILSVTFQADFAELSAQREILGIPVNTAMLIDPRNGGLGMYDITEDLFGPVGGPQEISLGIMETGVFEVDIDDSFWPALATGNIGLWALFTDTDDGWFGIDYLSLVIETRTETIESFFQGMTNDGFKIDPAPADGAGLSAPLRTLRPFGSTGTGFDEAVSSKAIHVIPAPGAGMILAVGGCVMLRRSRHYFSSAGLFAALLVITGAASLAPQSAHASETPHFTDEMLISESRAILHAEVVSVRGDWNATRDQIWTTVELRVIASLKNDLPRDPNRGVTIRQLGGSVGDMTLMIVGQPEFIAGDESILFFGDQPLGPVPLVGMRQGMLRITNDPVTGERVILDRDMTLEAFSKQARDIVVRQQAEFEEAAMDARRLTGLVPLGPEAPFKSIPTEETREVGGGKR